MAYNSNAQRATLRARTGIMSEFTIHIGVHKTGTSAIQNFLCRNRELLATSGYYYQPTSDDRWPNHHVLAASFMKGSAPDLGEGLLKQIILEAKDLRILMSSEMLCEPDMDIQRFLSALRGHTVKLITYIRHPCDILISAFNEVVRHYARGWSLPINEEPFAFDPSQYEYLSQWLDHADIEISICPYDPRQWTNGSLIEDFMFMINVPLGGYELNVGKVNPSLSFWAIERLRELNALKPTESQHAELVAQLQQVDVLDVDYPLTDVTVATCLRRMADVLPFYRRHFRLGFNETYLLSSRPSKTESLEV